MATSMQSVYYSINSRLRHKFISSGFSESWYTRRIAVRWKILKTSIGVEILYINSQIVIKQRKISNTIRDIDANIIDQAVDILYDNILVEDISVIDIKLPEGWNVEDNDNT